MSIPNGSSRRDANARARAPRTDRARELRRDMTGPERRLWDALRSRRFAALKFRRQVPIGRYFVDFVDAAHQLVLELDGDSHIDRGDYDLARERWLESQGLHVLRFANDDVLKDLDAVLEAILHTVAALEPHRMHRPRMRRNILAEHPSPPLEGEGGRRPDEASTGPASGQEPRPARPANSDGSRSRPPSSGPAGHLLPQGEKAKRGPTIAAEGGPR